MSKPLIETGLGGLSIRFLAARRLRAALTAIGVALGVALIVAMTVLGATLQASITEQLRQGFGTYDIMAGYQDGLMSAEEQSRLARLPGIKYAVGVLYLSPNRRETQGLEMRFNYIAMGDFPPGDFAYPVAAGRRPGAGEFAAEQRIADLLGIKLGESITVPFRSGPQRITLVGILPSGKASSDSLILSLPYLQEQMGLQGQATLQVFGLSNPTMKDIVGEEMRRTLPRLDIQLRKELDDVIRNMGGLKPMATAFGIAGLFASVFLVAGSFNIAVQERSRELALLRAVGAGQKQVMRLVLREALLLGALGAVAGLLLGAGTAVATTSVAAVSMGVQQHPPVFPWPLLLAEWAGGVLLAMLAAWSPARSAGAMPPLAAMRPDAQREAIREKAASIAGVVVLLTGAGMMALSAFLEGGSGLRALVGAVGGLLVAAGIIMAVPRILPWLVGGLAAGVGLLFPAEAEAVMAGRAVLRHRKRSALTAATLILGIMLITSVTTVFGEISRNGDAYTRSQFAADAQVEAGRVGTLAPGLPGLLAEVPGVTGVAPRGISLWGELPGGERRAIVPVDLSELARVYDFGRVEGQLDGPGLTVTEKQARDLGMRLGDVLHLTFDKSLAQEYQLAPNYSLPVTAIVERLPFPVWESAVNRRLFPQVGDSFVYFDYQPERWAEVKEAVLAILRRPGYGTASLRDLREVLEQNRQALNQRWAIVGSVVGVTIMISGFGLVNSVLTGLHQRRREMATVRAIGATPAQTARQVMLEAVLLGFAGSLLGLASGGAFTLGVALGLDEVFSRGLPYWLYLGCVVVGPLLGAAASLPPALRVSRGPVAPYLQAE